MKKKLSILLVALMSISFLVACTPRDNGDGGDSDAGKNVDIREIHTAVKEEFGENYLPEMQLSAEELEDRTKVNPENVEEFIAELPMISAHVDEFMAVKAIEGKGEEVETTLEAYREYLNEEIMQYPMNMEKVKAAKVVRHGDYVFFLMLGKFNEAEDATEEEALEFAESEVKRAEDVIAGFFK